MPAPYWTFQTHTFKGFGRDVYGRCCCIVPEARRSRFFEMLDGAAREVRARLRWLCTMLRGVRCAWLQLAAMGCVINSFSVDFSRD